MYKAYIMFLVFSIFEIRDSAMSVGEETWKRDVALNVFDIKYLRISISKYLFHDDIYLNNRSPA